MSTGEFSVCQFFSCSQYEYVRRYVSAEEAGLAFAYYTTSVGARSGTTIRVIITDERDQINAEWKFREGLVFPIVKE
mgnify:CR=1 FL=1